MIVFTLRNLGTHGYHYHHGHIRRNKLFYKLERYKLQERTQLVILVYTGCLRIM